MSEINLFIKNNVSKIAKKNVFVTPNIPEKKLNNAVKAFKCEDFYQSILAIFDNTIFGACDEGLIFTGEKLIFKQKFIEPTLLLFEEMKSAKFVESAVANKKGKTETKECVEIVMADNNIVEIKELANCDYNYLAGLLDNIIKHGVFKEENQLIPIPEMPDELKEAYLKIIVNMTFMDDENIDDNERAEIFLLITRLNLSKDSRIKIRSYIYEISRDNLAEIEDLLDTIKKHSQSSRFQWLMVSLAKDMINVHFNAKDTNDRNFKFLSDYQSMLNLSNEEIEVAYVAVEKDRKILKENLDDNAIKKNIQELATKAASAGVPLAAVYISGSVMGMSAAGITSGLAALGVGMGMTGGLLVVGLIGIVTYDSLKRLTGAGELDKYRQRNIMLIEAIKQTQKTISLLVDDVNFIVQKLNDALQNHDEQSEKVKKLEQLVQILKHDQGALKAVDAKSNYLQNSKSMLNCPKKLDVARLQKLTNEPSKKFLYDFVVKNYEQDGEEKELFVLKDNIDTETLDKMGEIFKTLGYFDVSNFVKAQAADGLKQVSDGVAKTVANHASHFDDGLKQVSEGITKIKGFF